MTAEMEDMEIDLPPSPPPTEQIQDLCLLEHQNDKETTAATAEEMEFVHFGYPHPLLIDHAIKKIIGNLIIDKEDDTTLNSRLVCQIWDTVATKTLRSHSNKTIYFGKYFQNAESLREFTNYLKMSSSLDHFPVGKFYLCEDIFRSNHLHTVQTFFSDCASLLTSLTIRLDNQSDLKVSELTFDGLRLSNLKSFVFDDRRLISQTNNNIDITDNNHDTGSAATAAVSCFLEGIVKSSPNLRQLTVTHPPSSMFDDEETASTRRTASEINVAQMLVNRYQKHLNYLNLDILLNDKVLLTLSELSVRITELQLCLRESIFSNESLNKLLDTHKESLQNLRLCSLGIKSHFEITFPILPKLQLLELHSWDSQIQGVTFSKLTYESHFPALQSLVFHTWAENSTWIQFFPAAYHGTVPSLISLKLPQNFMYPAMIQNLSWLYPNLTKMELHYSRETVLIIQRVFSHFSEHLEELKISDSLPREKFDFCLDSLFTGLPQTVCEKILRGKYFNPDEEKNHLLKLRQNASLLNLKNLKKLDIEDLLRHETYVTDVTGYLVLLQMPNLRHLHMGRSQIDDECLGQLVKKYHSTMQKELYVPKATQRMLTNSASNVILTRAPTFLMTAYNYCFSADLVNNCTLS